jgi:hypothetical protein
MSDDSRPWGPKFKDLTGRRFGRLTAVQPVGRTAARQTQWRCRCDCGTERIVQSGHLMSGHTQSCGCLIKELAIDRFTTHGGRRSRLYRIWCNILQRCTNPNATYYRHYGGRGIKVCDRWRTSFANFAADVGTPPPGLSIDRIDNDGHYEPGNVRWATRETQASNQRTPINAVVIEYEGHRLTVAAWSRRTGIGKSTLHHRLSRGLSGADLFAPVRVHAAPRLNGGTTESA